MFDGLLPIAIIAVLLSISWNVYSTKKKVEGLYERNPSKVLECPYGYGLCHAFPFGHKPCECDGCSSDRSTEECTGCRDDE